MQLCPKSKQHTDALRMLQLAECFRHAHTFPKEQGHCSAPLLLLPWLHRQIWSSEYLKGHSVQGIAQRGAALGLPEYSLTLHLPRCHPSLLLSWTF